MCLCSDARRLVRAAGLFVMLVCAILAMPATAAAVTCERNSALLTVELDTNDLVLLSVSGGNIVVSSIGGQVSCAGSPTVNNTGAINVFNPPGSTSGSVTLEDAGDFAPGPASQDGSDNGGGTPEIEIYVNLNNASFSVLSVRDRGGNVRFGEHGINPNAGPAEVAPDVDIFPINVNQLEGRGGSAGGILDPAVFGAQGGAGTGPALMRGIELHGNGGNDQLTGGGGDDRLMGFDGNDSLLGGAGDDTLQPGEDTDFVAGGAGIDTLDYLNSSIPSVAVDLGFAGPQNTGAAGTETIANVENVDATPGPDILRGDDGPNDFFASSGNDVIEGGGGVDTLNGGMGTDSIDARDGGPDTVDCGPDSDKVLADAPGVDTLTNCEDVSFAAAGGPDAGGDTGGGNAGGGGGGGAAAIFGQNPLVTLRLVAARVPARGPLKVKVVNGNAFPVAGILAGRTFRKVNAGRTRHLRLRAKAFTLASNAARTVKLNLPKALRRLLARKRTLDLRMTAKVTDPAGNLRTVTKRVTPKLKRPSSRRASTPKPRISGVSLNAPVRIRT